MDKTFYTKDIYLERHPGVHAEDSYWKINKIMPLLDKLLVAHYFKKSYGIKLLDIGGGAGLIMKEISEHIENRFNIKVTKLIMDLSPAMLKIQKNNNPDSNGAIHGDISQIPIHTKQIDIVLCIDVLEHVPDYRKALAEIKRVSRHSIIKVPLEDNIYIWVLNLLTNNLQRKHSIESAGHLHFFNYFSFKKQINANCGAIIGLSFTNNIQYLFSKKDTKEVMGRLERKIKGIALLVFKISPKLCSILFNDFAIISVSCY